LVKADGRTLTRGRPDNRELHLVAISVRIGRRQDRPELEVTEPADTLEAVADLLFLEGQLRGIGEVLQAAAAAPAEVGAGRVDSSGRRALVQLDPPTPKPRACLDDSYTQATSRQGPPNEDEVPLDPAAPLAAEGEVVEGEIENPPPPRFRHDWRHYIRDLIHA